VCLVRMHFVPLSKPISSTGCSSVAAFLIHESTIKMSGKKEPQCWGFNSVRKQNMIISTPFTHRHQNLSCTVEGYFIQIFLHIEIFNQLPTRKKPWHGLVFGNKFSYFCCLFFFSCDKNYLFPCVSIDKYRN